EWGVHVALFAARAGLSDAEIHALAKSGSDDPLWAADERLLIGAADQLHRGCDIDDATWRELGRHFADEAILEILMLAGFYRIGEI
ncbi:hypothetical protein, partial [Stenotrophomonas maltophilia]|uniref:hypothetical protein n=1 Tax=Stenotrophomonas maltophilia TaxID=40324 RepID=UPI001952D7E8